VSRKLWRETHRAGLGNKLKIDWTQQRLVMEYSLRRDEARQNRQQAQMNSGGGEITC
jgi:hypothetical protein